VKQSNTTAQLPVRIL